MGVPAWGRWMDLNWKSDLSEDRNPQQPQTDSGSPFSDLESQGTQPDGAPPRRAGSLPENRPRELH